MVHSSKLVFSFMLSILARQTCALTVTPKIGMNRAASKWGVPPNLFVNLPENADQTSTAVKMSVTIDTHDLASGSSSGPAVLDRPVVEKEKTKSASKENNRTGSGAWEVRIYNDGMNTREFVARCLVQVAGLSEFSAYETMMQAHQNGIAVVGRYVFELAEMYHDALKKNGIICDVVPVDEEN